MKESKLHIMESMDVKKAIIKLALPTMLAMIVQIIYNLTDTFFVGRLNDANQVAALSLVFPIFLFIISVGNIFANGGASYISRCLGEKKYDEAKKTNATCFYSAIILGIIFTIVIVIFMDPLLNIIGTSENTFQFTKDYTMILSFFSVFLILQIALSGMVRSEGETAKAMLGMIIGSGINIVLDPIFISVLNMGIGGAAWATVIGNFCGVLYYLIYYLRKKSILSISPVWFKPTKKIFKEVSKIGVPASLGQLIMGISFILVNVVASSYGDYIVAGNGVQMRVVSIATLIIMGISQGYQPFAGYNYGAKNSERLIKSFKITMLYNTVLSVLFTVLFALFSKDVIKIFINDPQVIDAGAKILRAFLCGLPFLGIQSTLMMTFQATGKALRAMFISLGRQCIFYIPLLFTLNALFGFNGFIFAQPIADIITTFIAIMFSFSFVKEIKTMSISVDSTKPIRHVV